MNKDKRAAFCIMLFAAICWAVDAGTKYLVIHAVPEKGMRVIRGFLYFFVGINHGGSNGIPSQYMEFCLTLPAVILFVCALWIGKNIKAGKQITLVQQLGFGALFGGALANWSERVLHHGVTDFILLKPFAFCIFNCADVFIDIGYTLLIIEAARLLLRKRATNFRTKFHAE